MSDFNDRVEDAKCLLGEVSKDITDLLTMAQMTGPLVQGTIEKVKLRINQVEKLFSGKVEV
jgi:hypothetical protein